MSYKTCSAAVWLAFIWQTCFKTARYQKWHFVFISSADILSCTSGPPNHGGGDIWITRHVNVNSWNQQWQCDVQTIITYLCETRHAAVRSSLRSTNYCLLGVLQMSARRRHLMYVSFSVSLFMVSVRDTKRLFHIFSSVISIVEVYKKMCYLFCYTIIRKLYN